MDTHAHALVIQTDTLGPRVELARELFESGEASVTLEHHLSLWRAGTRVIRAVVTSMHAQHDPIDCWFNAAVVSRTFTG